MPHVTAGSRNTGLAEIRGRYSGSGAVTGLHAFPDRGHSLVLDHGWREVAKFTLSRLAGQGL
ncbi:MAG: hypothetical protein ACLPKE_21410 [Streptosporangiaceae bacterium]